MSNLSSVHDILSLWDNYDLPARLGSLSFTAISIWRRYSIAELSYALSCALSALERGKLKGIDGDILLGFCRYTSAVLRARRGEAEEIEHEAANYYSHGGRNA